MLVSLDRCRAVVGAVAVVAQTPVVSEAPVVVSSPPPQAVEASAAANATRRRGSLQAAGLEQVCEGKVICGALLAGRRGRIAALPFGGCTGQRATLGRHAAAAHSAIGTAEAAAVARFG